MRFLTVLVAICLLPPYLFAGETPADNRLRDLLSQLNVRATPEELRPAPIPGFLEVVRGLQVLYVSADGATLIDGDILSLADETNLTERTRAAVRRELLAGIPGSERIVLPAHRTKRAEIVVFADTNCPFCLRLHRESGSLRAQGIEIQYLLYPRSGPESESFLQAVAVWCAADRLAALESVLNGRTLPAADCANPVLRHYELARELELKGTPAIIAADGTVTYGVPDVARIVGTAAIF